MGCEEIYHHVCYTSSPNCQKDAHPLLGFWTLANAFYTVSNLTKFWNRNALEQENKGGMEAKAKASLEGGMDLWVLVQRTYTKHTH